MPIRSGVRSVRHLHEHLPWNSDATGILHQFGSSAFLFINNNNTMSQLRNHEVRAAQMWWLNLIIELATVSVIYLQKLVNIKLTI